MNDDIRNKFITSVETMVYNTLTSKNKISLEDALQCYDTTYHIMNYYDNSYNEIQFVLKKEIKKQIIQTAEYLFNIQSYKSGHYKLHAIIQFFEKCENILTKNMTNAFAPYSQYIKVYHKSSNDNLKNIILSSLTTVLENNYKQIIVLMQNEFLSYIKKDIEFLIKSNDFHKELYKTLKKLFENIKDEESQIDEEFFDINGELCISSNVLLKKWSTLFHKYNYMGYIKKQFSDISQYISSFQFNEKLGVEQFYKEYFSTFYIYCKLASIINSNEDLNFTSFETFEKISQKMTTSKYFLNTIKNNNGVFYFEDLYIACCEMNFSFIEKAYSTMYSITTPLCKYAPFTHQSAIKIINKHVQNAFYTNLKKQYENIKDELSCWITLTNVISNYFYLVNNLYKKNNENSIDYTLSIGKLFNNIFDTNIFYEMNNFLIKTKVEKKDYLQHFLLVWIQNIIKYSEKFNDLDQILYCFFTILNQVEDKDVFLHTFVMSAKKRFIHRRFNITLECSIQLHLENIIGNHPFLTEYQNMITDLQFPPLCWEGQKGIVLNKSSWKHLPIHSFKLHPNLSSLLDTYTHAYQFNFPDRQLFWSLFYSHCSFSLVNNEKEGPEIKCCVIAANIIMWIHDLYKVNQKEISQDAIKDEIESDICHVQFWCNTLKNNNLLIEHPNNSWSIHPRVLQFSESKKSISLQTPSLKKYNQFCLTFTNNSKMSETEDYSPCLKKARTECMLHRPSIIQAKIVNIMKNNSGLTLKKSVLFEKVQSVITIFKIDIEIFNQQIEKLKDLDYILEKSENMFEYIP